MDNFGYDPMKTPRAKYDNDPAYRNLVQMLTAQIMQAHYTPSEIREAALFACIQYEMMNVRKVYSFPKEQIAALDTLNDWTKTTTTGDTNENQIHQTPSYRAIRQH